MPNPPRRPPSTKRWTGAPDSLMCLEGRTLVHSPVAGEGCFDDPEPLLERVGGPVVTYPEGAFVGTRRAPVPVEPALVGNPYQGHVELFDDELGPRREVRFAGKIRTIAHHASPPLAWLPDVWALPTGLTAACAATGSNGILQHGV